MVTEGDEVRHALQIHWPKLHHPRNPLCCLYLYPVCWTNPSPFSGALETNDMSKSKDWFAVGGCRKKRIVLVVD